MKKIFFAIFSCVSVLIGNEKPLEIESSSKVSTLKFESQISYFPYISIGVTGNMWGELKDSISPDPFLGMRSFITPSCAIDFGGGFCGTDRYWDGTLYYFQTSFLIYPEHLIGLNRPIGGAYLGLGYTVGVVDSVIWQNVPATFGYQFRAKNGAPQFIQMQVTPLFSGTVSYGFGF